MVSSPIGNELIFPRDLREVEFSPVVATPEGLEQYQSVELIYLKFLISSPMGHSFISHRKWIDNYRDLRAVKFSQF